MAVILETKERRVIPNWRDYKRTLQIGELGSNNKLYSPIKISIDRAIIDWNENRNIGTAADLINSAFVAGIHDKDEINSAIKFIRNNLNKASKSLLQLTELLKVYESTTIIHTKSSILEIDIDTVDEFQAFINNHVLFKIINKTKNRTRKELYNPIVWIDLARLYSLLGQEKKAERAVLIALHLAPNNRFVLRSATRFFIHAKQFEKALYYLRKSRSLKNDPWLISAHIATSSIMGRYSPLIKDGKRIIKSKTFSDFETTELAISIGSLEYNEGSFKKAKQLLQISMRQPNDNSLAQMEWLSRNEPRLQIDPFSFNNVINPFEAYAFDNFENGQWKDAFYNCIKWFLDIPFSKRPIILGSFIAGSLLKDKPAAIALCEVGLQANPRNPTLLNNIIYDFATSDNIEKCYSYIDQLKEIDLSSLTKESKICIQATLGLVAIRDNDFENGNMLYKLSIENAGKIKNDYLKNLSIVNFTRELILKNLPEKEKYKEIVKEMEVDKNRKDLVFIRDEVIDLINKDNK